MRWTWFLAGLAASVALSAFLWTRGVPGFALFLLFPFAFGFRALGKRSRPPAAEAHCPRCGYLARGPDEAFCPRDGTPFNTADKP